MSRISIYPFKVITMNVPASWIDEAIQESERNDTEEVKNTYKNWSIARIIGLKAFCSYYKTPFETYPIINSTTYKINTIPINEYSLNIGKNIQFSAYKDRQECYQVFQTWFLPRIDIIGFKINSKLTNGRNKLFISDIEPISNNHGLSSRDKNKFFI